MDLNKLDSVAACEKGFPLSIKDAEDNPTDIVITVVGVDSKIFRNENARIQSRIQMAEKRGKKLDQDELEQDYCALLAKCTLGWENVDKNGKPWEFSQDAAQEVYESYPIIKSQVFTALFDRAAFLGNVQGASVSSSKAKPG